MPNIPDHWIDTTEAVRRLGVTRARVIVFCKQGRLKAIKVGEWRIDPASVAKFAAMPRPQGWKLGRKRKPAGE